MSGYKKGSIWATLPLDHQQTQCFVVRCRPIARERSVGINPWKTRSTLPCHRPTTCCPDPLLVPGSDPEELRRWMRPTCASSPMNCAQETIDAVAVTGGHLAPARGDRTDRGAALRVRHAARPADLGRRRRSIRTKDLDRAAATASAPAPGRRLVRRSPSAPRANTTRSAPRICRTSDRRPRMAVARDLGRPRQQRDLP